MDQTQIEQGFRLRTLIKSLHLNQTEFAKSLGTTQPNINRMVIGRNRISMEVLNGLANVYPQVNLHWLLTGRGNMLLEGPDGGIGMVREEPTPYQVKEKLQEAEQLAEEMEGTLRKLVKTLKG